MTAMAFAATRLQHETGAWRGRLELGFARRAGGTICARRRHSGPLRVQRPFYPEGRDLCHVYLLHPPGGVVGGDELDIEISLEAATAALLTTPAAGKFYRSNGAFAHQRQRLRVADGAALEWLPQETIVFDGAHAVLGTCVELQGGAHFTGWEILCLGRPGAGEGFQHGRLRQAWEIRRDGVPLFIERTRYQSEDVGLTAPWGLSGQVVSGTLVSTGGGAELAEQIRAAAAPLCVAGLFSASRLAEALVCRYLGPYAEEARRCFVRAWELLRPAGLGRPACPPRIWAT
jgi:urease accessory protein